MLQVTQRQTSPRARIFGQRPRGSGACQPAVTSGDGLTKSRTGARAQSSGVTGAHTHGDTCRTRLHRDKLPRVARGLREDVPGTHEQGHAHDGRTHDTARAHTAPRRPRLGTSFEGLGGSRQAWRVRVSFSTVTLALPGPRGPRAAPRPAVARTCRPHEARQRPPLRSGPSAGPTPLCARAGRPAARLGLPRTTTPRRHAALHPHSD